MFLVRVYLRSLFLENNLADSAETFLPLIRSDLLPRSIMLMFLLLELFLTSLTHLETLLKDSWLVISYTMIAPRASL